MLSLSSFTLLVFLEPMAPISSFDKSLETYELFLHDTEDVVSPHYHTPIKRIIIVK